MKSGDHLQARFFIFAALLSLLASKCLNVLVPFTLKRAVDALEASSKAATPVPATSLLCLYALTRLGVSVMNEMRTIAFTRVSQRSQRAFQSEIFQQLHALDAAFHSSHPTGYLAVATNVTLTFTLMAAQLVKVRAELPIARAATLFGFDSAFPLTVFLLIFNFTVLGALLLLLLGSGRQESRLRRLRSHRLRSVRSQWLFLRLLRHGRLRRRRRHRRRHLLCPSHGAYDHWHAGQPEHG